MFITNFFLKAPYIHKMNSHKLFCFGVTLACLKGKFNGYTLKRMKNSHNLPFKFKKRKINKILKECFKKISPF